jgi:hypothetical protein
MVVLSVSVTVGLGCALAGQVGAGRPHDPPTTVPKIAQIAGVRVGYDTRGEMERRLGKGMVYTGGHAGGAREWVLRGTHWYIDADAFDYYRFRVGGDTVVLYDVSIGKKARSVGAAMRFPPVRVTVGASRKLGWLGVVFPGMSKSEVLRAIHGEIPLPKRSGNEWSWTSQGFLRLNRTQAYHTWTARLTFRRGRLEEIDVSCERES